MCELSRSLSSIEDTLYEVKSEVRDLDIKPIVDIDYDDEFESLENQIKVLSKKINVLAEITLKLSGVDTYKMTKKDLRKRIRKDVDELSADFDLFIK